MNKPMPTKLNRNVWVTGVLSGLSTLLTILVLRLAGMPMPDTAAQWIVYFLCFTGIWKCLECVAWFVLLLVAPTSKLLDPVGR